LVVVIKESAIAVNSWILTFAENSFDPTLIQIGDKLGSLGFLNAVNWPEDLRYSMQINQFSRLSSLVLNCKTLMV
jgi:hypothetical protein